MRESRLYGSVRGALGDQRPYRDPQLALSSLPFNMLVSNKNA